MATSEAKHFDAEEMNPRLVSPRSARAGAVYTINRAASISRSTARNSGAVGELEQVERRTTEACHGETIPSPARLRGYSIAGQVERDVGEYVFSAPDQPAASGFDQKRAGIDTEALGGPLGMA